MVEVYYLRVPLYITLAISPSEALGRNDNRCGASSLRRPRHDQAYRDAALICYGGQRRRAL